LYGGDDVLEMSTRLLDAEGLVRGRWCGTRADDRWRGQLALDHEGLGQLVVRAVAEGDKLLKAELEVGAGVIEGLGGSAGLLSGLKKAEAELALVIQKGIGVGGSQRCGSHAGDDLLAELDEMSQDGGGHRVGRSGAVGSLPGSKKI
jgi:hypothetical protein